MIATLVHDPNETAPFVIDWSYAIDSEGGEVISSSSWSLDSGITQSSASFSDETATVVVTGGTVGTHYKATNTISTSAGRTYQRTLDIEVRSK